MGSSSPKLGIGILATLHIRTFFAQGHDAYLAAVSGNAPKAPSKLLVDAPWFRDFPSTPDPAHASGVLPAGQTVLLGEPIRKGPGFVVPVGFYEGDSAVHGWALLGGEATKAFQRFDWNAARNAIRDGEFRGALLQATSPTKVRKDELHKFQKKHSDAIQIHELDDGQFAYFATRENAAKVERIRSHFLDSTNLSKVLLQTRKDYQRPTLNLDSQEK